MFAILSSLRNRRVAARNYRILSALDDATLADVGLDRNSLWAVCAPGAAPVTAPGSRPRLALAGLWPPTRGRGKAMA